MTTLTVIIEVLINYDFRICVFSIVRLTTILSSMPVDITC